MNQQNQIILENSLSNLTPETISKGKMLVDKSCIIFLVPDTNISLAEYPDLINKSGLLLSTCKGVLLHSGTFSLFGKSYNTKSDNEEFKKSMKDTTGKKLSTFSSIESSKKDDKSTKYYIYNLLMYRNVITDLLNTHDEKQAVKLIFKELSNLYQETKKVYPLISYELMFLAKDKNGFFYNLINNASSYIDNKILNEFNLFDTQCLVSNGNFIIYPFMWKEEGKNVLLKSNLTKIKAGLEIKTNSEEVIKTSLALDQTDKSGAIPKEDTEEVNKTPDDKSKELTSKQNSISDLSDIISNDSINAEISKDGNIKVKYDKAKLNMILRKYKIEDPDIISNVKIALEKYITLKKGKISKDETEQTVLKAINYTIYGTEEINEDFLSNPEKLINKLSQVRTHKTPLEFPDLENYPIKPSDIVDIKHTTGVWRQKLEFEQTIHKNVEKLFNSISSNSTNKPIIIKEIKNKIVDDEMNRYIDYTITLQNLNGGEKNPYDVNLKVPASVNDRYFKLGGNMYIMATQQFLKPITKTDKNEVRIITSYGVIRIALKNLKFNPSDIDQVLEYINVRYPILIKSNVDNNVYTFSDNSTIYLSGDIVYKSDNDLIKINKDTGKLIDKNDNELKRERSEYIYEILLNKINTISPDDKLTKTKKTIPYISIYLGGIQVPLIIYLWQLKGLMTTLNDLGIEYEITKDLTKGSVFVERKLGDFLVINPKNVREKLLVNGILASRFKGPFKNLDDPEEIHPLIDKNYGQKATVNMRLLTQNILDPITKELLEFENLPTNLPNLVTTHCIDVLLNKKTSSLADLKNYRARLSEMILHVAYKQLMQAHNKYVGKVEFGTEDAKLYLDPEYIMRDIQMEAGVLQHVEPVNPVDEIFEASRTIKSGKGGVPKRNMFKPEHR